MDATKVTLSPEEMELLLRPDWILTKNRVMQKAKDLLEMIQERQQKLLDNLASAIPTEVYLTSAKVSRGENYQGLPYLILDQPRYFNKDHIFAIRTFFWWGHFFSCTLHLSGDCKIRYEKKLLSAFEQLQSHNYFICINADPWQHHFDEDNFISIKNLDLTRYQTLIRQSPFVKLSRKISLEEWSVSEEKLASIFEEYISIIANWN